MTTTASIRYTRISPQKLRLVADQVRNMPVEQAVNLLSFSPKKGAAIVKKVLESAIANAEHNDGADIDELHVVGIQVDEGPVMGRFRARARGRAGPISKRMSHITLTVAEK